MGRGTGVRAASARSIEISFEYHGRCREKIRLAPNAANLKFVQNLKARIEHDIAVGSFDYGKYFPSSHRAAKLAKNRAAIILCGELFTAWLKHAATQLEPETYGDYKEYIENVWRPRYGAKPITALTLPDLYDWIDGQTAGRKRILNLLTPLRQAVRYAIKPLEILKENPLAGIQVKRPAVIRKDIIDPFSPDELALVLPKLEPEVANMMQFWAWTGLREGELIALTWADIDLDRGLAFINKTARGKRRKAPKTYAGHREIKLLPPALEALQRQKAFTRLAHREVFLNPGTRLPWGHDKPIRNRWREGLVAAGVRYRFPRQLRHTFASWMLMSREDPMWVSKQMGHADVSITLKVYAKYIPAMNPDAGMGAYRAIIGSRPNRGPA